MPQALAEKLLPRDLNVDVAPQTAILKIISFAKDADGRPLLGGVPVDEEAAQSLPADRQGG